MRPKVILGAVGVLLLSVTTQLIVFAGDHKSKGAAPPRSSERTTETPDEVVDKCLRDSLVDRDNAAAKVLQCRTSSLTPMDSYVADLTNRETRFNVTIASTWTNLLSYAESTDEATVQLDLIRTVVPATERTSETWTFGLTDENGWKATAG